MEEKERVASEEAEKRLKAALTAKREPSTTTSRVASPNQGESSPPVDSVPRSKTPPSEPQPSEVVPMEVAESNAPVSPPTAEV